MRDFMQPDRIVVGAFDEEDGDAVAALYDGIDAPVVRADVNSAEMIKLAANAFLMTRISFINEIANVCEATGADVVKVAEGVGLDQRLGPHFLRAGIGYGGSLLPEGLARAEAARVELGLPLPAPLRGDRGERAAEAARDRQSSQKHLGSLRGKTVALLGLAFKPNTDDMREAPSIVLASRLLAEGAEVRAWDPVADGRRAADGCRVRRTVVLEAVARRRRGRDRDRVAGAARPRARRDPRRRWRTR